MVVPFVCGMHSNVPLLETERGAFKRRVDLLSLRCSNVFRSLPLYGLTL